MRWLHQGAQRVCHVGAQGYIDAGALLEGWPSGLRRTLGKRVYGKTVSWVRIPLPPPVRARLTFSAACEPAKIPNKHGASRENLRTATHLPRPKIPSLRPFFSKPP